MSTPDSSAPLEPHARAEPDVSPMLPAPPLIPVAEPARAQPASAAPIEGSAEQVPPVVTPPVLDPVPAAPPVLALSAPMEPPVLESGAGATTVTESARRPLSLEMGIAVILTGILTLLVCITVSGSGHGRENPSYRAGLIVGAMTVWPLLIIGVLSIWRRFRSARARAIALLVVWGLTIVGQSGNLIQTRAERVRDGWVKRPAAADMDAAADDATDVADEPAAGKGTVRAVEAAAADDLDFSAGSNERLVKQITNAQQESYRRVAAAYRAACDASPADARLALERVRFLEHFVNAEDVVIESADADYDLARKYLETRFPEAAGTVLFVLEHRFGDEFTAKAAQHARQVEQWPKEEAAKFYLLQAQRENLARKAARVEELARKSFALVPTAEAGLLLAQAAAKAGRKDEAGNVLQHAVFSGEVTHWLKKQRMELLFDVGRSAEAREVLDDLRRSAPLFVRDYELAKRLARGGQVAEGRTLLVELGQGRRSAYSVRQRFAFELEFGDAEQAAAAYHQLRDVGAGLDPLGRERFELLWRHPSAGWSIRDVAALGSLLLAVVVAALLPLLLIGPVHHWSLWRQRAGRAITWTISPWNLREAWCLAGLTLVGVLLVTWYFNPGGLPFRSGEIAWNGLEDPDVTGKILPPMVVLWALVGGAALVLLGRTRSWRLLGPGRWRWAKAVGVGVGFAFALRVAVFVYVLVFPNAASGIAQVSPVMTELLKSLHAAVGPLGLLGVIAGFVPVLEELVFRGLLLGAMTKHIPFAAANLIQAVGFAAMHESLLLAPFFVGFGLLTGVLVRRAEGLLPAIVLHAANNALAGLGYIFITARTSGVGL